MLAGSRERWLGASTAEVPLKSAFEVDFDKTQGLSVSGLERAFFSSEPASMSEPSPTAEATQKWVTQPQVTGNHLRLAGVVALMSFTLAVWTNWPTPAVALPRLEPVSAPAVAQVAKLPAVEVPRSPRATPPPAPKRVVPKRVVPKRAAAQDDLLSDRQ